MINVGHLHLTVSPVAQCTPCSFFKSTTQRFSPFLARIQNKAEIICSDLRGLDVLESFSNKLPSAVVLIADLLAFNVLKRQNSILCKALSLPFLVNATHLSLKQLENKDWIGFKKLSVNKKLLFSLIGNLGLVKIWNKAPFLALVSHLSLSVLWKFLEKKGNRLSIEYSEKNQLQPLIEQKSVLDQILESASSDEQTFVQNGNLEQNAPLTNASDAEEKQLLLPVDESSNADQAADLAHLNPNEANLDQISPFVGFSSGSLSLDEFPLLSQSNHSCAPVARVSPKSTSPAFTPKAPRAKGSEGGNKSPHIFPSSDATPFFPPQQKKVSLDTPQVVFGDTTDSVDDTDTAVKEGGAAAAKTSSTRRGKKNWHTKFKQDNGRNGR